MCNSNNPEGGHKCCGWLIGNKYRHQTLRALFWVLAVLGFVFAIGLGVEAARFAKQRMNAVRYARMGYRVESTADGYKVLPRLIYKFREEAKQPTRLFGEVVKVEENKITVLNNGAAEQIVLSLAETRIIKGDKEVGINSIEKGDAGVFAGFVNKDGLLEARVIELK